MTTRGEETSGEDGGRKFDYHWPLPEGGRLKADWPRGDTLSLAPTTNPQRRPLSLQTVRIWRFWCVVVWLGWLQCVFCGQVCVLVPAQFWMNVFSDGAHRRGTAANWSCCWRKPMTLPFAPKYLGFVFCFVLCFSEPFPPARPGCSFSQSGTK